MAAYQIKRKSELYAETIKWKYPWQRSHINTIQVRPWHAGEFSGEKWSLFLSRSLVFGLPSLSLLRYRNICENDFSNFEIFYKKKTRKQNNDDNGKFSSDLVSETKFYSRSWNFFLVEIEKKETEREREQENGLCVPDVINSITNRFRSEGKTKSFPDGYVENDLPQGQFV